jgi:hypothetical protein
MSIYRKIAFLLLGTVLLIGSNFVLIPTILHLDVQAFDPVSAGSLDAPLIVAPYEMRPFYVLVFLVIHPLALVMGILAIRLMISQFIPPGMLLLRHLFDLLLNGVYLTSLVRSIFVLYVLFYAENTAARQEGIRLQGIAYQFIVMQVSLCLLLLCSVSYHMRVLPHFVTVICISINLIALVTSFFTFDLHFPFALRSSLGVSLITTSCVVIAAYLLLYESALHHATKTVERGDLDRPSS